MTAKGASALRQELERLKTVERPKLSKAIAEARAHGDLRENAEYHAAREMQGFTEARIRDLENKLANANIIDVAKIPHSGIVVFGTTVHVVDESTGKESTYQLVGDDEADLKNNKISINSPIARALVSKRVDDSVEATIPSGVIHLQIVKIEYI